MQHFCVGFSTKCSLQPFVFPLAASLFNNMQTSAKVITTLLTVINCFLNFFVCIVEYFK